MGVDDASDEENGDDEVLLVKQEPRQNGFMNMDTSPSHNNGYTMNGNNNGHSSFNCTYILLIQQLLLRPC